MSEELEELRQEVQEHEERIQQLEEAVNDTVALDKQLSMVEFVNNECEVSTHKERVLAIGYYLEAYDGQDSFTKNDIADGYTRCGTGNTNFSARAGDAVEEGWLKIEDDDAALRHWSVTKTGAEKAEEMMGEDDDE